MAERTNTNPPLTRRALLGRLFRWGSLGGVATASAAVAVHSAGREEMVWQIDPHKCTRCGRCATHCVLTPSAVKCVHTYNMCGYCDICTGFLSPERSDDTPSAENEMCPTGAIQRSHIEGPYFEYTIIEDLCIGCGKCVEGCTKHSNGSLYLQILHDRCKNCNECTIAAACPAEAIIRVPASKPYILKQGVKDNPPVKPTAPTANPSGKEQA